MPSSISSSDPGAAWRRQFSLSTGLAALLLMVLYAFIAIVDPWNALSLSPPLKRAQLSNDARFWFPSLAREPRFDSAVLGTSTSRLLRPDTLDKAFGGSFANLAMNSASAYEQSRLLEVLLRHHPSVATVIVGLDFRWCALDGSYVRNSIFDFPEWLYDARPWSRYLHVLSMHGLQDALKQLGVIVGLTKNRFGSDGYTNFLPDDGLYDLARAQAKLTHATTTPWTPAPPRANPDLRFPALTILAEELSAIPLETRKILFFTPTYLGAQPSPGRADFTTLDACKAQTAAVAASRANTLVVDFDLPSPITQRESKYWDNLHYRVDIADRIVTDLADAWQGRPVNPDYRVLWRDDRVTNEPIATGARP